MGLGCSQCDLNLREGGRIIFSGSLDWFQCRVPEAWGVD